MSGVNFFDHDANSGYDFSALEVYVNDELTNIPANALTAAAGDDIRIVSLSKPYPFFYPRDKDYIASIEEPLPFMDDTDFSWYFYDCNSLVSIPENLFINNPQITSFYRCFGYCDSLTSIPRLFDNNPNVTDFSYCFYNCNSLTSIPVGLFDNNTKVTKFYMCFYSCGNLTVNVQIGSTTTDSVDVNYFAERTAAKGTVYCRAGSAVYNAFLNSSNANVNVLTY